MMVRVFLTNLRMKSGYAKHKANAAEIPPDKAFTEIHHYEIA